MAPHLGRAWGILQLYKGLMICAFHHTRTHTCTHTHTHTQEHKQLHACVFSPFLHTDMNTNTHTHQKEAEYTKWKESVPGGPHKSEMKARILLQSQLPLSTCVLSHLLQVRTEMGQNKITSSPPRSIMFDMETEPESEVVIKNRKGSCLSTVLL